MKSTPQAMRKHVAIVGNTNAGKSTLFNLLTGQEHAIVSEQRGTTTDPVQKSMELIPFGPIVLIDTAGLSDSGALGAQRMKKTGAVLRRCDAALYTADAADFPQEGYEAFLQQEIPHLLVLTRCDLAAASLLISLREQYPRAVAVSSREAQSVALLREKLSDLLSSLEPEENVLVGDLVSAGGTVVLVVPIDSEAPKGRLILPQVQVLRDCLDHGILCMVVRETELADAMQALPHADLVVTDSQVFPLVNDILEPEVQLTSFSMLMARQKGGFDQLLAGVQAIDMLPDGARVLLLEGCTHNHTHEDIGRVKIPAMLRKKTGKLFAFEPFSGYDFPDDLSGYDFAVQCGSCMLSSREVQSRMKLLDKAGVPVSNYGMMLAWGSGILERSSAVFST